MEDLSSPCTVLAPRACQCHVSPPVTPAAITPVRRGSGGEGGTPQPHLLRCAMSHVRCAVSLFRRRAEACWRPPRHHMSSFFFDKYTKDTPRLFFFDRVSFGWRGVCVEPAKNRLADLRRHRSCEVVPECISDTKNQTLLLEGSLNEGMLNAVLGSAMVRPILPCGATRSR